jgi:hypothetical protein
MSMCSLTDFIEASLGPVRMLAATATVTGEGASQVDTSVRGGDFSWPKVGTFVATSGDLKWPIPGTFSWPRTQNRQNPIRMVPGRCRLQNRHK